MLATRILCLALALGLLPAAASAEGKKHRRLMLMDLPADKAFDTNTIKVLNSFLAKDLRDEGFEVITPTDIGAALGFERQKQLLGWSESACLAEIGGAMGADFIIHGELASLPHGTAVTLTLDDTHGQAVNQVAEVVKSKDAEDLIDALKHQVPKLVAPVLQRNVDLHPREAASTEPAGGLEASRSASAPSHTGAYVLLGASGVSLAAAGVFGVLSYSAHQAYHSDGLAGRTDLLDGDKSRSNTDAAIAWGGLAVSVATGVLGYLALSDDGAPAGGQP